MATDYDAPRKVEEETESIQALQERVPDKLSGAVDSDDADNPGSVELAGQDLANVELDVVVLPPQEDEFTCVECFPRETPLSARPRHEARFGLPGVFGLRPRRCPPGLDNLVRSSGGDEPVRRGVAWVVERDFYRRCDPGA